MTDGTHSRRHTAKQRTGAAVTAPCHRGETRRGPDSNRRTRVPHIAWPATATAAGHPTRELTSLPSSHMLKIHLTRTQELSVFKKMYCKNGVQDP